MKDRKYDDDEWGEELNELKQKYKEKVEPLLDQLQDVAKELGLHGVAVFQAGNLFIKEEDGKPKEMGFNHSVRTINTEVFQEQQEEFGKSKPPDSMEEAKEFVEKFLIPSPLLLAILDMTQGRVDPQAVTKAGQIMGKIKTLSDTFGLSFEDVIEKYGADLFGDVGMPPGFSKSKRKRPPKTEDSFVEIIEDGKFVGFRNIRTGEEERWDES